MIIQMLLFLLLPFAISTKLTIYLTQQPGGHTRIPFLTNMITRNNFTCCIIVKTLPCSEYIPTPVSSNKQKIMPHYKDCPKWEFTNAQGNVIMRLIGPHGLLVVEETMVRLMQERHYQIVRKEDKGKIIEVGQSKEDYEQYKEGKVADGVLQKEVAEILFGKTIENNSHQKEYKQDKTKSQKEETFDTVDLTNKPQYKGSETIWHFIFLITIVFVVGGTLYLIKREKIVRGQYTPAYDLEQR